MKNINLVLKYFYLSLLVVLSAICSGADKGAPSELGFATNIAQVPVLIWHGEKDGSVPVTNAYTMQKALQKVGNNPEIKFIPNRGHSMNPEDVLGVNN